MAKRRQRRATRLLGLPLLLAVPSSTFHTRPFSSASPRRPQHYALRATSTVAPNEDTAAATESTESLLLKDVIDLSRDAYRLLDEACYTTRATPTISFKFARPVAEREGGESVGGDASESEDAADNLRRVLSILDSTAGGNAIGDPQQDRPVLLHLPGLDGVGISAIQQFDDLSDSFEFWRMSIDPRNDRTSFAELVSIVSRFVQEVAVDRNRRLILSGESFGGLLAPAVALAVEAKATREGRDNCMIGMVLVNPATSFYKTNWNTWAPILASLRHIEREGEEGSTSSLPTPYSVLGGMALSMTVPDSDQLKSIFDIVTRTRVTTAQELRDVVTSMADGFGILADRLPAEVIEHRVTNWLNVGSEVVNSRLEKLQVPTLVIGGEEDNMLPTKEECDRLVEIMPNCTAMSVKGAGHFVLDDRLNLTEAITEAPFDPFGLRRARENYNPITDWKAPTDEAIQEAIDNRVKGLRDVLSPKFFSTSADGRRSVGLGQVPNSPEGPMLFVANHQLLGLDLGLIIAELLERRGIAARGLAHPVVFAGGNGFGGGAGPTGPRERVTKRNRDGPVDRRPGDFETFGAVMVTPKNFYKLMETNQTALLFPGGVREVFHRKGEDYDLFWPEDKADFVRVAARFNATIVPISAIGSADSANILLDPEELVDLPFGIGDRLRNSSENTISARFDKSNSDELFVPPLVTPGIPARHYFVFGKPFHTASVDHNNRQTCMGLYSEVKSELRRGLDDLIVARETDPFKDFAARLAVERLSGKQAPTFSIDELNK